MLDLRSDFQAITATMKLLCFGGVLVVCFGGMLRWYFGVMMLLSDVFWCCVLVMCLGDVCLGVFRWWISVVCFGGAMG